VTNNILISATPQYHDIVMNLVQSLDIPPESVHINTLIAEVTLNNDEEFGVEIGLQSPVFFNRTLITGASSTVVGAAGSTVPAGVTLNNVTSTITNALNFNQTAVPSPQQLYKQGTVGFQGLGNLGVGRANASGVGGFVFSAGSDTLNVLVRALKRQGRVDIVNCPSVQTLNNQTAAIQVGQKFPYLTGGQFTQFGTFQPDIAQYDTGVNLKVTPRVNPDGKILMRVEPSIVTPQDTLVSLGNGQFATAFNIQAIQTTVLAGDGETIVLGGLLSKTNDRRENKVPVLGDLPGVGSLFRYRTQSILKTELIMVLTPHIVRNDDEQRRILERETAKMHWSLKEINANYGFNPDHIKAATPPAPLPGKHAKKRDTGSPTATVPDVIPLESEAPKPAVMPSGTPAPAANEPPLILPTK
jgi:type II secretory pathway component GspD/PulD (secretin)